MLTAAERACMAAAQALTMEDIVRVRDVLTPDGRGGSTATQSELLLQGRVGLPSSAEREQWSGGRAESEVGHVVTVPLGSDVKASDRLRASDGRVFEVKGVGHGTLSTVMRCFCAEVL